MRPSKSRTMPSSTASNRYLFVSSMGSNAVNVVDLKTMSFSAVVPAGGRPRPYVISSDGKTMYVAVSYSHGFDIVNIPEKKVLERVEMPARHSGPPRPRKFETPDMLTHGLALTPDGKELWRHELVGRLHLHLRPAKQEIQRPSGHRGWTELDRLFSRWKIWVHQQYRQR